MTVSLAVDRFIFLFWKRVRRFAVSDFLLFVWPGGLTSSWFCVESTLLTLAIAATAFSFYRDRTMPKARKMFHASLLFLPVFMSGLLLHRVSNDNQQPLVAEGGLSNSASGQVKTHKRKKKRASQAPVAYASAAPFPFLPAPSFYYSPWKPFYVFWVLYVWKIMKWSRRTHKFTFFFFFLVHR